MPRCNPKSFATSTYVKMSVCSHPHQQQALFCLIFMYIKVSVLQPKEAPSPLNFVFIQHEVSAPHFKVCRAEMRARRCGLLLVCLSLEGECLSHPTQESSNLHSWAQRKVVLVIIICPVHADDILRNSKATKGQRTC